MVDSWIRLNALLMEEDRIAAERLAVAIAGTPNVVEVPALVRVLEDVAIVRRFQQLLDAGETRHHAWHRCARELSIPVGTVRYRLENARRPQLDAAMVMP